MLDIVRRGPVPKCDLAQQVNGCNYEAEHWITFLGGIFVLSSLEWPHRIGFLLLPPVVVLLEVVAFGVEAQIGLDKREPTRVLGTEVDVVHAACCSSAAEW